MTVPHSIPHSIPALSNSHDARFGSHKDNGEATSRTKRALKLCTILLYAERYRPERTLQHYRTIQCLPIILGPERRLDAEYLDACRTKRNRVEYDYVGGASDDDVNELVEFARECRVRC